jgi:hypothetical protein
MNRSGLYGIVTWLMLGSCLAHASAADVTFTATVDKDRIGMGERFTLSLHLENAGMGGGENLKHPDLTDFYVLSGPNQSSSIQFINGKVSSSVTYTYHLQPKATGTFTIESASIDVDDRTYASRPIRIDVLEAEQDPQRPETRQTRVEDEIADNLFLKAIVDKEHVVQGEQLNLTYKIYTRVSVSDYAIRKVPAFTGFWSEEVQAKQDLPVATEVIDGREFRVGIIKQVSLFPTQPGELEIGPMEVQTAVQVRRSRRRDPFDSFFDDPFESFFRDPFGRTVQYMLRSDPLTVHVDPLPEGAPTDFNGAVGTFHMVVSLDTSRSVPDEPLNLAVSLKGTGNIKLLGAPDVVIPPGMESYPPTVSDQIRHVNGEVGGSKTFEYLLIPRRPGKYRIDPITYTYFTPSKGEYITIRSKALDIEIEPSGRTVSTPHPGLPRADVEFLALDIRYIKLTDPTLARRGDFLFMRPYFISLVVLAFVAFVGVLSYGKKVQSSRGNVSIYRRQRAMKVARERLKRASLAMRDGEAEMFYTRLSQAVWGYLGDRLSIAPGHFSMERMITILEESGIPEDVVHRLEEVLETCSMASYAPGHSEASAMGESFAKAKATLSDLERALR